MFFTRFKFKLPCLFSFFSELGVAPVGWQPLSVLATTLTEVLVQQPGAFIWLISQKKHEQYKATSWFHMAITDIVFGCNFNQVYCTYTTTENIQKTFWSYLARIIMASIRKVFIAGHYLFCYIIVQEPAAGVFTPFLAKGLTT